MNRRKVFISYSTGDTEIARRVRARLDEAGFLCCKAPEDIMPGESWPRAITRALEESWAMVLICSKHSLASPEVSKELTLAMSGGVTVIPYRIESILPTGEWAYHLANIQWFDAFDGDPDTGCRALATHLTVLRGDNAVGEVIRETGKAPVASPRRLAELAERYLQGLTEDLSHLSGVFTMPGLQAQGGGSQGRPGPLSLDLMMKSRQASSSGFDLANLAKPGGRRIVTGLPGSGKSTLMRMLALDAARSASSGGWDGDKITIPVFLELGRYEKNSLLGLSLVRENLSRFSGTDFPEEEMHALLASKRILWVMDGLDEGMIGESRVNESPLWREIEAFVSRYPGHSYVISTRKIHIPAGRGFETLLIKTMTPEECRGFMEKYLRHFGNDSTVEEIYAAMPESLRKVADSPLVLSMVLSIHLSSGTVPGSIQELYGEFVSHTLREVEAGRSSRAEPYVKDMALAALAFDMITSSRPSFRNAEAVESLGKRLSQLCDRGESGGSSDAKDLLDELVYSGLLVRQDYQVTFLHMTLLEYFAECEMSREYNFTASAEMDQYFLRNPEKIAIILKASSMTDEDHVIEVGAGIGSVARHFPPTKSLCLVDLDPDLIKILRYRFPDIPVHERDALEVLRELPCDVLISNLPFFLTTGILDILADKPFKRSVMSVHADDDFTAYEGKLSITTLATLLEEDFFPRQPFQSKLILVEPCSLF